MKYRQANRKEDRLYFVAYPDATQAARGKRFNVRPQLARLMSLVDALMTFRDGSGTMCCVSAVTFGRNHANHLKKETSWLN